MSSRLAGDSRVVLELEHTIRTTLTSIDIFVNSMVEEMHKIDQAFRDDAVDEIRAAVTSIESAVESSRDGAAVLLSKLAAYRAVLENAEK